MGTDNFFHKRKAKAASELNRKQAAKPAYAKILMVCEGEKTEPHYFKEVVDHYELSTANVSISGEGGSAPRKVFEHATSLLELIPTLPLDRVDADAIAEGVVVGGGIWANVARQTENKNLNSIFCGIFLASLWTIYGVNHGSAFEH